MHRSQIDSNFFSAPPTIVTPPPSTTASHPSPSHNLSGGSLPLDLSPSASPVSEVNIDDSASTAEAVEAVVEAWGVEQVVEFVSNIAGCAEYAEVSRFTEFSFLREMKPFGFIFFLRGKLRRQKTEGLKSENRLMPLFYSLGFFPFPLPQLPNLNRDTH